MGSLGGNVSQEGSKYKDPTVEKEVYVNIE